MKVVLPSARSLALLLCLSCAAAVRARGDEPATEAELPASHWLERLKHGDPEVRAEALSRLARGGEASRDAVPAIAAALTDEHDQVRRRAVEALKTLGPIAHAAAGTLVGMLESGSEPTLLAAAEILGHLAPPDSAVVPALVVAVRDRRPGNPWALLQAIHAQGAAGIDALRAIVQDASCDGSLRGSALDVLGQARPPRVELVPVLSALLGDPEPNLRSRAAGILGRMGAPAVAAVPALRDAALAAEPPHRECFLLALAGLGEEGQAALRGMVQDATQTRKGVRAEALSALIAPKPPGAIPVELLRACLNDGPRDLREKAAAAAGTLGSEAKDLLPDLLRLALDPSNEQPQNFLTPLPSLGETGLAALRDLLQNGAVRGRRVRAHALYLLCARRDGPPEPLPALLAWLRDDEPDVRAQAAGIVGAAYPEAAEAVDGLVAALDDPRNDDPQPFVWPLRRMGPAGVAALRALIEPAPVRNRSIRTVALNTLLGADPKSKETLDILVRCLNGDRGELSQRAAEFLKTLGAGAQPAVPALVTALKRAEFREAEVYLDALQAIGPAAAEALPELETFLTSTHPSVRPRVQHLIRTLRGK